MSTQVFEGKTTGAKATEAAKDQRSFIETLQRTGDVVFVDKEVHWDLELGAISRRLTEMDGPAGVFRTITDPPGPPPHPGCLGEGCCVPWRGPSRQGCGCVQSGDAHDP